MCQSHKCTTCGQEISKLKFKAVKTVPHPHQQLTLSIYQNILKYCFLKTDPSKNAVSKLLIYKIHLKNSSLKIFFSKIAHQKIAL